MINEKKKMTAQGSSVGADDGQSISKTYENSIPTSGEEINDEIVNSPESLEEVYRRMQRMADPRYLHTLTMTELFQTAYMSRPPVAEGLLYAGAYILAGAPKIGKSFLVAQIVFFGEQFSPFFIVMIPYNQHCIFMQFYRISIHYRKIKDAFAPLSRLKSLILR